MAIEDAITAFRAHYNAAFDCTDTRLMDTKRLVELHPSSFPYCGLRHAYQRMTEGDQTEGEAQLFSDYFLSVGTTVHSVLQEWVGKVVARHVEGESEKEFEGDILGNWECTNPKCGAERKFATYKHCLKCGAPMRYEELLVKFGKYLIGHCDGVIILGSKEEAYVLDYKTTSSYAIQQHRSKGKFPYMYNVKQIESYAALLQHLYPLRIKGWMLVYCFHPDTLVTTKQGKIRIENYVKEPSSYGPLLSYNHDSQCVEWTDVSDAFSTPNGREMVQIDYEGGSLTVTEDHPIWSVTRNCYITAGSIQEGEEVLAID